MAEGVAHAERQSPVQSLELLKNRSFLLPRLFEDGGALLRSLGTPTVEAELKYEAYDSPRTVARESAFAVEPLMNGGIIISGVFPDVTQLWHCPELLRSSENTVYSRYSRGGKLLAPLFDRETAEAISLVGDRSRSAWRQDVVIDTDGAVIDVKLQRTKVKVDGYNHKTSNLGIDEDYRTAAARLIASSRGLEARYLRLFNKSNESHKVVSRAQTITEIFTLILNSTLAELMSARNFPFLYCSSRSPRERRRKNGAYVTTDPVNHPFTGRPHTKAGKVLRDVGAITSQSLAQYHEAGGDPEGVNASVLCGIASVINRVKYDRRQEKLLEAAS